MTDQRRRGPGLAPPSPNPQQPRFVGMPKGKDPVVESYTKGVAARAKAGAQDRKVQIPDLGAAMANFRPGKDGPMTLSNIAQAQENIRTMTDPAKPHTLKPDTIAGLRALQEQVQAQNAPPTPPPVPSVTDTPPPASAGKSFTKTAEVQQQLTEASDIDFDMMMRRLRNDVLNNEEEKAAIESRLVPMDLADGLITGEFKQHVPITPGKLEVVFRSISPLENEEMRRKILEEVIKDERLSGLAGEKLSFYQTVASVHSLNGTEMPRHTRGLPGGGREFLWDVFDSKRTVYMSYPSALIHSLSTHAYWFDLRVRKLFVSASLKNG